MRHRPSPLASALSALGVIAALTLAGCGDAESSSPEASPEPSSSMAPTPAAESPSQAGDSTEAGDGAESPVSQDSNGSDGSDGSSTESAEKAEDSAETQARRAPGSGLPPGGTARMAQEDLHKDLHGEDSELSFYSDEGAGVGVAGLDPSEDRLAVYAEPTRSSEVTAELESLDEVNLAGRERSHREPDPETQPDETAQGSGQEDVGTWVEIELADGYGWFHRPAQDAGIYWFGGTTEVTEDFQEVPAAEDPRELAESVGTRVADAGAEPGLDDPDFGPSWVLLSEPADFDEGFYRIDVTGFMGHSVAGNRLLVHVMRSGADTSSPGWSAP